MANGDPALAWRVVLGSPKQWDIGGRIEERHDCSTRPVNRGQVGAFMQIAVDTCQRQIFTDGLSAVLERCQLINVMRARVCQLRYQAVCAAFPGPLKHQTAQMLRYVCTGHGRVPGGASARMTAGATRAP